MAGLCNVRRLPKGWGIALAVVVLSVPSQEEVKSHVKYGEES